VTPIDAPANTTFLVVGPDPKLRRESEAALAGIADAHAVLHHVADFRRGVEAARSRHPALVLVEMTGDFRALEAFAEEMAAASPGTAVAAVFSPDVFGPDVSEGAIIIEAIRAGVQDFLRRPLSSADLGRLIDRLVRRSGRAPRPLGKTIFFVGNKGGVGKSTVAVNVACGLAVKHPEKVLLVDASLQMGVCATMLDLKPTATMTDAYHERDRLDETLLRQLATPHACGLHLLAAPADAIEAAYIDDEIMSRILTLGRRSYDYVIVDSFPLLDRVMMAVLDLSDRAYVVLESVVPTLLGGAKLLRLFDDLGIPPERIGVVLNRYMNFAGNLRPADVARLLGRPVDYVVPYKKDVIIAANVGRPSILRTSRFFGFGRAITRLIHDVSEVSPASRNGRGSTEPMTNGMPHEGEPTD
jgi:pilus assembly protein CpaE